MPTIAGSTLGEKHRHYNYLIQDAIARNKSDVDLDDIEAKELIKIDIAAYNKDLEYILKVLQSQDLLYVSRALKKSQWLATNSEYAHIINPIYLKEHLFPQMTLKARTLLMKFIKKHIKDETRAEQFFHSEDSIKKALKWLPKCSILFIEKTVREPQYFDEISSELFKKLCERSITIFEVATNMERLLRVKLDAVSFVRKHNIESYLNAVDKCAAYSPIQFDSKTTDMIMKHCPDKIVQCFDKYFKNIHIPTFAKYVSKVEVKDLLYKQASLCGTNCRPYPLCRLFTYDNLKYLIKVFPESERFDFAKKVFIDDVPNKTEDPEQHDLDSEVVKINKLREAFVGDKYDWYQIAPFDVAFADIQKLITTALPLREKYTLITILIKCARSSQQNIKIVLTYYKEKNMNDGIKYKVLFVNDLLTHTNICKYDKDTLNILDDIFKTMDLYETTHNDIIPRRFVETIIIYRLITNQAVPEKLENKFVFNTLKKYHYGLKSDKHDIIFNYIHNLSIMRLQDVKKIKNIDECKCYVILLKEALELLRDWGKNLVDYPVFIDKIKELITLSNKNFWKIDLSPLYDVNKSWRRILFEESLQLKQDSEVAINSLKHDPAHLKRHSDILKEMCSGNKTSLIKFLRKVRLYWSQSMAKEMLNKYFTPVEDIIGQKNARYLFTLMSSEHNLNLIYKYVPQKDKIDWNNDDSRVISIQKNIAKNMHMCRPQLPPDAILSYAKGDYLQYAIPSILAMFHNLNLTLCRQYLPKLLDAPVSLQKHGIRIAVTNLEHEDLMKIFRSTWTSSNNSTIRATLFKSTHTLLCKETCNKKIDDLWDLLKMFISVLTFQEDKKIYELLYDISKIPTRVKPSYIETNYKFLESYIPHCGNEKFNLEWRMKELLGESKSLMEAMNEEFIIQLINKYFDAVIRKESLPTGSDDSILSITSVYLLCAKDVDTQSRKYNNILRPLLLRFCEIETLESLLNCLYNDLLRYVGENNVIVPVKMFSDIYDDLVKTLNAFDYYYVLKRWRITMEWAKIIEESSRAGRKYPQNWTEEDSKEPVELGQKITELLKEDLIHNLPGVYIIHEKIIYNTFLIVANENLEMTIYKSMLQDQDFVPIYLAILKRAFSCTYMDWSGVLEIIKGHPSLEVKLHYDYFNKKNC